MSSSNQIFYQLPVQKLLAITAYGEAATEGIEGLSGVLNVIGNRTKYPDQFSDQSILVTTGNIYHAVILKPYQFSVFNNTNPGRARMERFAQNFDLAYRNEEVLRTAYDLAGKLLSGLLPDNTHGATFYHATSVLPSWASEIPVIGQIGNHIFYGYQQIMEIASNPINWAWIIAGGIFLLLLIRGKRDAIT